MVACGSRTSPIVPDGSLPFDARVADAVVARDVQPDDVPLVLPDCGVAVGSGGVRFRVRDVVGRTAIDDEGNLYAPTRTANEGRGLVSLDPCGRERWRVTALPGSATRQYQGGAARLTSGGDVLLTDVTGDATARTIFRYDTDGNLRTPYVIPSPYVRFIGAPVGRGPLVATSSTTLANQLDAFDLAGRHTLHVDNWSNVNECAITGNILACLDHALDLDTGRVLWGSDNFEIIDGTLRHALPPAIDTERGRIYVAMFGISSYLLVAHDLATGREIFRTTLATSNQGQRGLLMGAPVIDNHGVVYVYVNVSSVAGDGGHLYAVTPEGARSSFWAATSTRQDFTHTATHLLGRGGQMYFAVANALERINVAGGGGWHLSIPEGVNDPELALSTNGNLAVHTDDDQLLVVVTDSPGNLDSPWPAPGGSAHNANAR